MKQVKLTAEELRVLGEYLYCNPCSSGCCYYDSMPKTFDCFDIDKNGEYRCKLQKVKAKIVKKLYNE